MLTFFSHVKRKSSLGKSSSYLLKYAKECKLGGTKENEIVKDIKKRGKGECWTPNDSCCERETAVWTVETMRVVTSRKRQQLGETEECGVRIRGMTGDK